MILVTGATGLVGSHLVLQLLQNQKSVRAIFRDESSKLKTLDVFKFYNQSDLYHLIDWCYADISDVEELSSAFNDVSEVYHCAAIISFDPKDEILMRKINIEGTANLVNLSIDFKVDKFCFVSSISTLGDQISANKIIDENDNWNPEKFHSDYAITKYGAEMEVWRGQEEGLKVVIVNPGIILGPCFYDNGSGLIISKIKNGSSFCSHGSSGFVGVFDVVKAMILLMEKNIFGERFILVSENLSYKDLFSIVRSKYQIEAKLFLVKPFIINISSNLDWFFASIFRYQRKLPKAIAKSLSSRDTYSNLKIKKQLSFEFQSIQEVINSL